MPPDHSDPRAGRLMDPSPPTVGARNVAESDGEKSRFLQSVQPWLIQFFRSDPHETVMALALGCEVGGTGRKAVEAESFGDLPDAAGLLRPLAVTGVFGAEILTHRSTRTVKIKDDDLDVEASVIRTSSGGGRRSRTACPTSSLIGVGRFFQVGVEPAVPINERTGKNVGVRAILHFSLDDLFPRSLGRHLFGR